MLLHVLAITHSEQTSSYLRHLKITKKIMGSYLNYIPTSRARGRRPRLACSATCAIGSASLRSALFAETHNSLTYTFLFLSVANRVLVILASGGQRLQPDCTTSLASLQGLHSLQAFYCLCFFFFFDIQYSLLGGFTTGLDLLQGAVVSPSNSLSRSLLSLLFTSHKLPLSCPPFPLPKEYNLFSTL